MNLPKAITTGAVPFGNVEMDCYNLDDGRRVFSQRGIVRGLTAGNASNSGGRKSGTLEAYLARIPGESAANLAGASHEIAFVLPSGTHAIGREVGWLVKLCRAYDDASRAGALHPRQLHLADQARVILGACAEVGIVALVDEATGFQYVREAGILADIFKRALRDEPTKWQRTWRDDVVDALCRTFRIQRKGKEFPAPLMGVVGKLYRTLFGADVHEEMKRRNPRGEARDIHTQWMSDETLSALREHLEVIRAFAVTTDSKTQFWERLSRYAGNGKGQTELLLGEP